jgi:hypothetical protein
VFIVNVNAPTAEYIKTDLSLPLESPLTDTVSRNIVRNEGSRLICEIHEICGFLRSLRPFPIIIIVCCNVIPSSSNSSPGILSSRHTPGSLRCKENLNIT